MLSELGQRKRRRGSAAAEKGLEMSKKIYVGNLPFTATESELRELFERHGTVHSVTLIEDRDTGRPRGFGFVEMDDDAADAAIAALSGTVLGGRTLNINEARPRPAQSGSRRGGRSW
jgi:RNA recognition motif-containing protein